VKKALTFLLVLLVGLPLLFFAISYLLEFRPEAEMQVSEFSDKRSSVDILPDTLKIMSWNIGYAGLGDNMDFFMDGGQMVRDTRERTEQNLSDIIEHLKKEDADIYLIQEVDLDSHRTYGINEVEAISDAFPDYFSYYAPNFKAWFVPVPLKEPIGSVDAGQLILSRVKPQRVVRVQYPSKFDFPQSMFNLKRCLLEAAFRTETGKIVNIGNTHCTAFDTGSMRAVEIDFLKEKLSRYNANGELFIMAGDWNQNPPMYKASKEETENEFFAPVTLDTFGMETISKILCDTSCYSMRYNDRPYCATSTKSILDFFWVSRNSVSELECKTIDLNFHSSDHNPVILKAALAQ